MQINREKTTSLIKGEFAEISKALFANSLSINYLQEAKRVFAEASSMFGLNILNYAEFNFIYFYILEKYICVEIDLITLHEKKDNYQRLAFKKDMLTLDFISQISSYENSEVPNEIIFFEKNFVLNLFVFLHECGHLNQVAKSQESSIPANHFSEFNADYYSLSKILNYYYTLQKNRPDIYWTKVKEFKNEHNLFRILISTVLLIIFLEMLSKHESADSATHPAIKKRFLYLILQAIQQLKLNFPSLFIHETIGDFIRDIYDTLYFIEKNIFEPHDMIFGNTITLSDADLNELQNNMKSHTEFENFNK